jgi:hypothetical protein
MIKRRRIDLGYFDNLKDAVLARIDAECRYFGEYAPINRYGRDL